MADQPAEHTDSGVALSSRLVHGIGEASEAALGLARGAADAVVAANKSMRTLAVETARTLRAWPGWDRSTTTPGSRWAASSTSRPRNAPQGEFLLFDGRVHTYEAVNRRINNVVRGLIEVGSGRATGWAC